MDAIIKKKKTKGKSATGFSKDVSNNNNDNVAEAKLATFNGLSYLDWAIKSMTVQEEDDQTVIQYILSFIFSPAMWSINSNTQQIGLYLLAPNTSITIRNIGPTIEELPMIQQPSLEQPIICEVTIKCTSEYINRYELTVTELENVPLAVRAISGPMYESMKNFLPDPETPNEAYLQAFLGNFSAGTASEEVARNHIAFWANMCVACAMGKLDRLANS